MNNINIIVVNYNTPELIERLIKSYYKFNYDKYQLIIIDGSDKKDLIDESIKLSKEYKNIIFEFIGYNIHHGPGLHYGMNKYKNEFFLLLDSDSYFIKEDYISYCVNNIGNNYGIGRIHKMDYNGYNVKEDYNGNWVRYLHPNGCLINYNQYCNYDPLIAHGSPFLKAMISLKNNNKSELLIDNDLIIHDYIFVGWNGTCKKFGYGTHLFNDLNNSPIYNEQPKC